MAAQRSTTKFYAMNPMGTVPVLRTADVQFISKSTAITEYIDHQFEGTPLTGRTAVRRAEIHMMQRRAETSVLDAVARYCHNATPGLGPALEINPCEAWGTVQKANAQRGLESFDKHLQSRDFVAAS
jgi:glutathione S-transferase